MSVLFSVDRIILLNSFFRYNRHASIRAGETFTDGKDTIDDNGIYTFLHLKLEMVSLEQYQQDLVSNLTFTFSGLLFSVP